jgi:hypothetical protein
MSSPDACPTCGARPDDHDSYGRCPGRQDSPSPVQIAVGVVIRRWTIHTAALVLAGVASFLIGYHTGQPTYRGCVYGSLHMRDGDVATSSVPGVDAECDDGTMVRYMPTARPGRSPVAV